MADTKLTPRTRRVNLTPLLFMHEAGDLLECHRRAAMGPQAPLSYFLVSRAIELALKAHHTRLRARDAVRKEFNHNLQKLYDALPADERCLDLAEYAALCKASTIYAAPSDGGYKGFEYLTVRDAVTGLKEFPDLQALESVANKLFVPQAEFVRIT
jgi:hypothetical protein